MSSGADQRKHQTPRHWPLNSPVTGEFPTQMTSNAKNVSFGDIIMCHVKAVWMLSLDVFTLKLIDFATFLCLDLS